MYNIVRALSVSSFHKQQRIKSLSARDRGEVIGPHPLSLGCVEQTVFVHRLQRTLPVLQSVEGQQRYAVVVDERASDHEAVEDLVAVELRRWGIQNLLQLLSKKMI